jgi:hypothetical protein
MSDEKKVEIAEYDHLRDEILRNQDLVGNLANFGLAFSAGFFTALHSSSLDLKVQIAGLMILPLFDFVISSLILRKLNHTYFIGTYIRLKFEPYTPLKWETFNHEFMIKHGLAENSRLSKTIGRLGPIGHLFLRTSGNFVLLFVLIQVICLVHVLFIGSAGWLRFLFAAVVFLLIWLEIDRWRHVRVNEETAQAMKECINAIDMSKYDT